MLGNEFCYLQAERSAQNEKEKRRGAEKEKKEWRDSGARQRVLLFTGEKISAE